MHTCTQNLHKSETPFLAYIIYVRAHAVDRRYVYGQEFVVRCAMTSSSVDISGGLKIKTLPPDVVNY